MDYHIKYYQNNILGIRFPYNLDYVEYFIDSKYEDLFTSSKYKWQQKFSGRFTLYYINDEGNQVQFKRLITKAGNMEDVNTVNDDDFDLRIANLVKYPHGKRLIKKDLMAKKLPFLSPLHLNPEHMEAVELAKNENNAISDEDFFESDFKQHSTNSEWKVFMNVDSPTYTLINLSNGHNCDLKGNLSSEDVYDLNHRLRKFPLLLNKKSPC